MSDIRLLYTTWPDAETARAAGREAVTAGLAACVNIGPPIVSIYRWEGRLEEAAEHPALFKTTAAAADALQAWIAVRHPYDTPCILPLPVAAGGHSGYADWLRAAIAPIATDARETEKP